MVSGSVLQERRLAAGKADLERLRGDKKRGKHRDAWEAVVRELDAAVRASRTGARAPEAGLWAARAREELWNVSRSRRDAAAAVAAYRKVEEAYPGSPVAPRALLLAAQLAKRTGDGKAARSAARRLAARHGATPEAHAVGPLGRAKDRARVAARASAQSSGRRRTAVPVDTDEDEAEEASNPVEQRASPPAPADPGAQRSAGPNAARPTPPGDIAAPAPPTVRGATEAASAPAGEPTGDAAATVDEAEARAQRAELPPEPEAPEPIPGLTVKAAVPPGEERRTAHTDAAAKARQLRSAARKAPASLAAQLGLKVRRVVIDPGHGGRDTGAIGPHGLREKDVSLSIGRALAERLRALGFTVILTRKDDSYVSLDERTRIANQARADLFVSVHCNAARSRSLSGVETWTLNVASDRYATRLANFENADAERTVSDLRLILADLATRANASDARDLAESVQTSLVRNLRARGGRVDDHGVKQALFYVLLGAHMPAILVESGFISNPAEEARLRSRTYQAATAEAIARGVKEFVDGRQRVARAP